MSFIARNRRRAIFLVFLAIILWTLLQPFKPSHSTLFKIKHAKSPPMVSKVIFPQQFPTHLKGLKNQHSLLSSREYSKATFQHGPSEPPEKVSAKYSEQFHHPLHLFSSFMLIGMNLQKCMFLQSDLNNIEVSPKMLLSTPVEDIVLRIIKAVDGGYDDYLLEMAPYFYHQIRLQYKLGVCEKHWFRMAGSSVWLEEYGVHMMVSRLAYSPDGSRNNPKLSFVYTELFTSLWKPVELSLVVPTNIENGHRYFKHKNQAYTIMNYPTILPVPFFHDYNEFDKKYLGPEDSRVILVKNPAGHEEPLLIFNAYHQKPDFIDDDEDDYLLKQMQEYRSMWVSWPWQYQKGKLNTDGIANFRFDNTMYNRAKELVIKNLPRQVNQKNWTPLISESLRAVNGYDSELLFVYRWANLQILKCNILNDDRCGFFYNLNERLVTSSLVGPLRGGTQLVNINELLRSSTGNEIVDKLIPQGREIWVAFARAHLLECGCGRDLYRPNLVVVVKDTITDGDNKKEVFKLSHVSAFMSLNVDIIPWNPFKPYQLCNGTNALIPNGISKWDLKIKTSKDGSFIIEDELHLSISVSDSTLDAVYMRGLLSSLIGVESLFNNEADDNLNRKPQIPQDFDKDLRSYGYNNDNLVCAMQASMKFCAEYGEEKKAIEKKMSGNQESEMDIEVYDEKMERYRAALYDLGIGLF